MHWLELPVVAIPAVSGAVMKRRQVSLWLMVALLEPYVAPLVLFAALLAGVFA